MALRPRIRWLVLLIIVATIVPPLIFGEWREPDGSGGDTWRNFIDDFQTLIAGVLAIFAAWWTVDAMHFTDERSQQRHEDLIDLSLRADKLRLERSLNPAFRILLFGWINLEPDFKEWKKVKSHSVDETTAFLSLIADHGDRLVVTLRGEQFNEAKSLVPGQISASLMLIEEAFAKAREITDFLKTADAYELDKKQADAISYDIHMSLRNIDLEYKPTLQGLVDLARTYKIEVQLRDGQSLDTIER